MKVCLKSLSYLLIAFAVGCVAPPPAVPTRTLVVDCTPRARVELRSSSLTSAIYLGETPLEVDTIHVRNSLVRSTSQGAVPLLSMVPLAISGLDGVSLRLTAAQDAPLYASRSLRVPPWNHSNVDLGLPMKASGTGRQMGVEFAIASGRSGESLEGFKLRLSDKQIDLPKRLELEEGEYIFQLEDPDGQTFSGLLALTNGDDDFVRFAYVPVFQKLTDIELNEIAARQREPRMYTTQVDGANTLLAGVWIGSRTSTEEISLGTERSNNIEVIFDDDDASMTIEGHNPGPRFYLDSESKQYVTIKKGGATVYGVLEIKKLRRDTTLTSFEISLSDGDLTKIMHDHKVIKKSGVYQAPEKPDRKIPIYDLTLGQRPPRGMQVD